LPAPALGEAQIALRIEQAKGLYGGEALPNPLRYECGEGEMSAGDWSTKEGLLCYSGGLWYRKTIHLDATQASSAAELDLGDVVSSVDLRVNGRPVAVRVAPPWRFPLTGLLQTGENRIELRVRNTLANHYQTIPSGYVGKPTSGLLGPVTLRFTERK
jgi:hypothetical protein